MVSDKNLPLSGLIEGGFAECEGFGSGSNHPGSTILTHVGTEQTRVRGLRFQGSSTPRVLTGEEDGASQHIIYYAWAGRSDVQLPGRLRPILFNWHIYSLSADHGYQTSATILH